MKNKHKYIASFIMIFGFSILGLFYWSFYIHSSNQINYWADYGSFIGGVFTPILTIVNIAVLIWLTLIVKEAGDKQKKKELKFQRKLLITNFRQSELQKLQIKLEEVVDSKYEDRIELAYKAKRYLTSLRLPFKEIFNVESNSATIELINFDYLIQLLDDIIKSTENEKTDELREILVNYHAMIVITQNILQKFILDELKTK